MKRLKNNRGEGQISVGVKIILAVVIGALILGGLYLLFDRVILRNTDRQIKELMAAGGSSEVLEVRTTDDSALFTSLSYTHDGVTWIPSEIPTYAKDAKVLTLALGGAADAPVTLCIIRSDNNVVALYVTGGFGAEANSRGHACYCTNLYSGAVCRIERPYVLGIVPEDRLPDFAKKTLASCRTPKTKTEREER